jgi:hypothetical protein
MSVAERLQKTPAQVALRWGIQMGQSVLPKSADRTRIGENFDIFDWSIPYDLMAKFSAIKQACIKTTFFFPSVLRAIGFLPMFVTTSIQGFTGEHHANENLSEFSMWYL